MICQACGIEAPTKYVSFHQNIGALVMRFSKSMSGELCKPCVHKHFWSMTGTTATLGWWGMISLLITPFLLLNNVGRYALCLGMPGVPDDARRPELSDEVVEKINPQVNDLISRLNAGEPFQQVVEGAAMRAGVTPGQVALYLQALAAMQAQSQQQ